MTSPLFTQGNPFFFALDKMQVKYDLLRAHVVDGATVTAAARSHGYSCCRVLLVAAAFDEAGMTGLLDERRRPERADQADRGSEQFPGQSWAVLAAEAARALEEAMAVSLSPRSIQRARQR